MKIQHTLPESQEFLIFYLNIKKQLLKFKITDEKYNDVCFLFFFFFVFFFNLHTKLVCLHLQTTTSDPVSCVYTPRN